jgi:hypothetical protein
MNYKRKKRHSVKRLKSKELKSTLKGWSYGGQIAKEIILRQEFKKEKSYLT